MASEIRNRFTDTEMQIARETDLPELLSHLGYQVKRVGRFHTTAEMDSLRIKDRRTWFRYSQGIGGDAITFLQQFCDKTFPEAVEYLLTFQGKARDAPVKTKPVTKQDEPPKEFALPPRNADDRRVFAYLRKRGIAAQVIRQFMNSGSLYEDAVHYNCVFVGRDHTGQAGYAGLRGTYDRDGKGFRGDVSGSDKNIGFAIPCEPIFGTIPRSSGSFFVWIWIHRDKKRRNSSEKNTRKWDMRYHRRSPASGRTGTSTCKKGKHWKRDDELSNINCDPSISIPKNFKEEFST